MINFTINPYYKTNADLISPNEIESGIKMAKNVITSLKKRGLNDLLDKTITLIGVGNEAGSKVYSLIGTKFCLKISKLGAHVGRNQEKQFELNNQCIDAIKNKSVKIEGNKYTLKCIPSVAVAVDKENAYTFMFRIDNTIRLWDEEKIPFADKDNWPVIDAIKAILRRYGGKDFIKSMDINGYDLLVDFGKKEIFVIDPYVPEKD